MNALRNGIDSKRWIGAVLIAFAIAGTSQAQTTQSGRHELVADKGQAGFLKIGMPFASLEQLLKKKVQLQFAGENRAGVMLEVSDLPSLGISTLFGVAVEGVDVFFVEDSKEQLNIAMIALSLPCSDLALLEEKFDQQTKAKLQTPAGLKYRISKNGQFAFDLQSKPACNAWIRRI